MAHFYTEFPVDVSIRPDALIPLVREWVAGMRRDSSLGTAEITSEGVGDELRVENENESLHICRIDSGGGIDVASKYELNEENGRRWTTEIVLSVVDEQPLLSVRVLCDTVNPEERLPTPYKPHIIKMAIMNGWGGDDGGITVSDVPIMLNNDAIDFASDVIRGLSTNSLPVVYVSAPFGGDECDVDVNRLAKKLGGLAHVVVEPNRIFSNRLAISAHRRNAYGGAIGVYWPDGATRRIYRIHDKFRSFGDMENAVYADIVHTLANKRGDPHCSWQFIREQIAVRRVHALKDENSRDYTEYCSAFDAENESLRAQLAEANREIARLNQEYSARGIDSDEVQVRISTGIERDYFPNEIISTIIWFLQKGRNSAAEGTRKMHIIDAIIMANECVNGGAQIARDIKRILSDTKRIDARVKRELSSVGFDIIEDGKHYKLVYMGDGRYTFSLSKTSSDHRAGKNLASDICNSIL